MSIFNGAGIEWQCPHCGVWNDSMDTSCEGSQCGIRRYLVTVADARRLGMRISDIKDRKECGLIDSYGWEVPKGILLKPPIWMA